MLPTRFIILALAIMSMPVSIPDSKAHGGRTAADGCHNDNKNGGRHCHGAKAEPVQKSNGDVYYPNCDAARRAGRAPIRRGQPGYGSHLDRDGDGIACE